MNRLLTFFSNNWIIVILIIASFLLLLPSLTKSYLNNWDECVYAEYGKEMKQTGHLMTYRWNNEKIFEKPPLYGWLMQLPFLFGINEFTSRIVSFISGIIILILVFLYTKNHISKLVAILSLIILTQSHFFISSFITVNADITETLFIFLGFYLWVKSNKYFIYAYGSGFMFGFAVLTKGLVASIFPLALLLITLITLDRDKIINIVRLLTSFLIVILPWHVYEILRHGNDFIRVYFIDNLYTRSTTGIFSSRPIYYYFKIIIWDTYPWFLFIIIFSIVNIRIFYHRFNLSTVLKRFKNSRHFTTIACTIIFFIILSLVKTKLRIYLIPIYPLYTIVISIIGEIIYLQRKRGVFLLIFFTFLALTLINNTIPRYNFDYSNGSLPESDKTFLTLKESKINQVEYLVHPDWRKFTQDKNIITAQLAYGDAPCIMYYSGKKVNLYYDVNKFTKTIFRGVKALFVINNKDLPLIKGLPVGIKDKNDTYTIFEN